MARVIRRTADEGKKGHKGSEGDKDGKDYRGKKDGKVSKDDKDGKSNKVYRRRRCLDRSSIWRAPSPSADPTEGTGRIRGGREECPAENGERG